jgi:hypothetical protein
MESMSQTLSGTANFGSKVVCRISRNGDLLHRCYVKATLPSFGEASADDAYVNRVGFALLKSVELRVGGQQIDKHYASWMHIWSELTHNVDMKALLDKLVGPKGVDGANYNDADVPGAASEGIFDLNIPLLFSFCRNPGLALPLIALQYHEIELWIEFESLANIFQGPGTVPTTNNSLSSVELWADYIFLDTEERKEFAQKPHEYLIEVTQQQQASVNQSVNNSIRLTFNHPTKFITWAIQEATNAGDKFTNFTIDADSETAGTTSCVNLAKLRLNGQDRFTIRDNTYFNYVQPYQHFECKPDLGINVYSFALKPAEHQPSGSCNLSRIDNVNLEVTPVALTGNTGSITVYAFSYNVFRVASGMGGLAYSN